MRYFELFEGNSSAIFGEAKKAYASLSGEAQRAIESWETANWTSGSLEKHVQANDEVAQEINQVFQPIRMMLPPRIKLFRGLIHQNHYTTWEHGILASWTNDQRVADHFAGTRNGDGKWSSALKPVVTDQDIAQLLRQFERTGFIRWRNQFFVQNKEHPKYYNIYDRNRQFVTDGDCSKLEKTLQQDNDHAKEHNDKLQSKGEVLEKEISRDDVVWITNRLNCKEFIVRR